MEKTFTQSEILAFFRTKKMLTTDKAANYLNISTTSLNKLTSNDKISSYIPEDKILYYDINDLDNYLRSNKKMSDIEIDNHTFKFINKNYKIY